MEPKEILERANAIVNPLFIFLLLLVCFYILEIYALPRH